ncbi:MAG: hypothetical protein M3O97_01525 [Thermoproteota archaeon]|nr:hypothetical protein [Thermoproteota archaeon]
MQLQDEYDVFVCYYERTGADHAESIMKILKEKGYSVYVAHMLRHLVQGSWDQLHDRIIRSCKIIVLINTVDAPERDEIIREITVAFPNGDTSTHSFWILRDQQFDTPHNSPTFQQERG